MPDSRETHRSFTVRVPLTRYVEIGELARKDSMHINQKVNELLTLGLDRNLKLDQALARLLKRAALSEDKPNG